MTTQTADHADLFLALDRTYGLIDGSASWSDCLKALIELAHVQACRLLLYDCSRAQSQIVEGAGVAFEKGRLIQHLDIDEALWRSPPGTVWLPPHTDRRHASGLYLFGYSVLDRDSAHILYLEFLTKHFENERVDARNHHLKTVLPHLHRACRLHRAVSGDDLSAFAAPDMVQSTTTGVPIELRLRRRFRLSKAEARVATLLSDGLAPRMIADRLNVSIHTVRSQLQAIFSKTDTSRQAELTSLILRETEVPRAICHGGAVNIDSGKVDPRNLDPRKLDQGERPPCP